MRSKTNIARWIDADSIDATGERTMIDENSNRTRLHPDICRLIFHGYVSVSQHYSTLSKSSPRLCRLFSVTALEQAIEAC